MIAMVYAVYTLFAKGCVCVCVCEHVHDNHAGVSWFPHVRTCLPGSRTACRSAFYQRLPQTWWNNKRPTANWQATEVMRLCVCEPTRTTSTVWGYLIRQRRWLRRREWTKAKAGSLNKVIRLSCQLQKREWCSSLNLEATVQEKKKSNREMWNLSFRDKVAKWMKSCFNFHISS